MGNRRVVRLMTNKEDQFYPLIGPLLSRREIVKELGFPLWDEPEKVWFVVTEKGRAVGVAAVRFDTRAKKRVAVLCSAYTVPSHRRQGIYRELTAARLKWIDAAVDTVTATATEASAPHLKAIGFAETRTHGRYTHLEKGIA